MQNILISITTLSLNDKKRWKLNKSLGVLTLDFLPVTVN